MLFCYLSPKLNSSRSETERNIIMKVVLRAAVALLIVIVTARFVA